jgi:hypothetical protein
VAAASDWALSLRGAGEVAASGGEVRGQLVATEEAGVQELMQFGSRFGAKPQLPFAAPNREAACGTHWRYLRNAQWVYAHFGQ